MTITLDRFAPSWAFGIASDLEAGFKPKEALANAASYLEREAGLASLRAIHMMAKRGWLGAERQAEEHRHFISEDLRYASWARNTARDVLRMRGLIIMGRLF